MLKSTLTSVLNYILIISDCYLKNDPITNQDNKYAYEFENRWNETMTCFKKFLEQPYNNPTLSPEIIINQIIDYKDFKDKALCSNCSKIYNGLRDFFWEKVVPSNPAGILSGVCYDIRDRFNLTGTVIQK